MQSVVINIGVLSLLLFAQAAARSNIVGEWESVAPTTADASAVPEAMARLGLVFRADGSFLTIARISCDGVFELKGDEIVLKPADPGSDVPERWRFRVDGDTLVLTLPEEQEMRLARLDRPAAADPPPIGRWGANAPLFHGGREALIEIALTRNARMTISMRSKPEKGRYRLKGNLLTLKDVKYTVRFEERLLVLTPLDGAEPERRFKRVAAERDR